MTDYNTYHLIWKPDQEDFQSLMLVRVPSDLQQISKEEYWTLMAQRIAWLMQLWMVQTGETQPQTHRRLCQALSQLNPVQTPPDLTEEEGDLQPLWWWTQEWAATLIDRNDILRQRIWTEFPVPVQIPEMPEVMQQWSLTHDKMTLADWLAELTYGMEIDSDL